MPDRWTALDDCLLEIDAVISQHNGQFDTREDFYFKRISWTAWRTLTWLWRREWVVLHGCLTYRDPEPVIIAALVAQRSARNFSYDGEHLRHLSTGETWFGVEVIAAEALTGATPPTPADISTPETLPAPDDPDERPWPSELRLPGIIKEETPSPRPERPSRRRPGRPSQRDHIIAAFNNLSDDLVRNAKTLAALFPAVLAKIPGSMTPQGKAARGFTDKTLERHLTPLFTERRREQD